MAVANFDVELDFVVVEIVRSIDVNVKIVLALPNLLTTISI